MLDIILIAFVALFLALGLKRPFIWVLAYIYIDIVAPQKVGWGPITALPLSLIAFVAAFAGWLILDRKEGSRFTLRQGLIALLLAYCGYTTVSADYPIEAMVKWNWVWKALFFAIFLPLTLRTKLRLEAAALVMVLAIGTIVGALTLGIANKFIEPYAGAVLGKIIILVLIILFIQRRPRGLFALKGRSIEA